MGVAIPWCNKKEVMNEVRVSTGYNIKPQRNDDTTTIIKINQTDCSIPKISREPGINPNQ